MKSVRALALLFVLALLPACGSSPTAPEIQDALASDGEACVMTEGATNCRGGYIGSGS